MFSFTMSGQRFDFDASRERLMGDEAILIEDVTGGSADRWQARIINGQATAKDMLLVAFLAKHRDNPVLEWFHFIKGVAPYSIEAVSTDDDAAAPKVIDAAPAAKAPTTRARRKPSAS